MPKNRLQMHFPMLKSRREVRAKIYSEARLARLFESWEPRYQNEFLDFCTGARGVKMLYDSFAKELLNPEIYPERLNELLSLILKKNVTILKVLPNDGTRIADESSLLVMDIVVKLDDGSIGNVEIQKVGYAFPGQRSACYSADLLLRQYKAVRAEKTENTFSYKDIKNVYTIVLFEKSTKKFHEYPDNYLHYSEQKSDTGIQLELLQKYCFIPIDIFLKKRHNKSIENRLEAWLTFLGSDDPQDIIDVIEAYPDFKAMYNQVYSLCQNMEKVMGLFSEELAQLDRNTVRYMMDEMQAEIDSQKKALLETSTEISQQKDTIGQQKETIDQQKETIDQQRELIDQQAEQISQLDKRIGELTRTLEELMARSSTFENP